MPVPLYVVSDPESLPPAFVLAGSETVVLSTAEQVEGLAGLTPGLVVVDRKSRPGVDPAGLAERLGALEDGWVVAVIDASSRIRSVSLGPPGTDDEVVQALAAGTPTGGLLELTEVLREIARVRHDLNNPLTSAMAEVQLLLLEPGDDPEAREALEVVQAQLRRMRDLIAGTKHLRPPRD